jgi:signal-transduction protein with cAMP-binding, CBS, and nucleotidyltransferase domain
LTQTNAQTILARDLVIAFDQGGMPEGVAMSETTVVEAKRFGVITCTPQASLREAAQRMTGDDISALVVVDSEGCLAGIITRTDLLRAHAGRAEWASRTVAEYMNCDVVTIGLHAPLSEVEKLLLNLHIHRVVAVRPEGDKRRPVAVISAADLVYHMIKELDE